MAADQKDTSVQDNAEVVSTESESPKAATPAVKAERLSPADLIKEFEQAQIDRLLNAKERPSWDEFKEQQRRKGELEGAEALAEEEAQRKTGAEGEAVPEERPCMAKSGEGWSVGECPNVEYAVQEVCSWPAGGEDGLRAASSASGGHGVGVFMVG